MKMFNWLLSKVATRKGYTYVNIWLLITCMIYAKNMFHNNFMLGVISPIFVIALFGWFYYKSYLEDRPVIDAFILTILTSVWTIYALTSYNQNIFGLILASIAMGSGVALALAWVMLRKELRINYKHFWPKEVEQ